MSATLSMPTRNPKLETILRLKVPVVVRIGHRRMSFDDVLALGPGAILELDMNADDPLALLINNKRIGTGAAVKVGENFGIKLDRIDSPRQRVAALGPRAQGPSPAPASPDAQGEAAPAPSPAPAPDADPPADADAGDGDAPAP